MKTRTIVSLTSIVVLLLSACGAPESTTGISAEAYSTAVLSNGVTILVHPQPEGPPLVAATLMLRGGIDAETPDTYGAMRLLAFLLRNGETAWLRELDLAGSELTVDVLPDALRLSTMVLAEDAALAVSSIQAAVSGEGLTDVMITEARDKLAAEYRAAAGSVAVELQQAVNIVLYKNTSRAVGLAEQAESLAALTPGAFRAWLRGIVRPDQMVISLAGRLQQPVVDNAVETFSSFETERDTELPGEAETGESAVALPADEDETPIILIDSPGATARLIIARRLPPMRPQLFYFLDGLELIFNGESTYGRLTGLGSQLGNGVPIDSSFDLRIGMSGHLIRAATPVSLVPETFTAIMAQMERLHSGTVLGSRFTDQEIADARNFLKGRLLRQTETPEGLARFAAWSAFYGFEEHTVAAHMGMIEQLNKQDLLQVADVWFLPRAHAMVIAGPADELREDLEQFGNVRVVTVQ